MMSSIGLLIDQRFLISTIDGSEKFVLGMVDRYNVREGAELHILPIESHMSLAGFGWGE